MSNFSHYTCTQCGAGKSGASKPTGGLCQKNPKAGKPGNFGPHNWVKG